MLKSEKRQTAVMKKYLVDTSILIDHLRGKSEATEFLKQDNLVISAVTGAELFQGARNKKEQELIQKLVNQFEISWFTPSISKLALELLKQYFLKFSLGFLDALIAATALNKDLILVTGNLKHFRSINNLKLYN